DNEYAVVIPKFITSILKRESPPIYGDGQQSRDFTFVTNVVDANLAAARSDVGRGEIINVACGETRTILVLAQEIARLTDAKDVQPKFLPPRVGDIRRSHADITRLKKILGVTPRVSFEEGLKALIQWFQTQKAA
ncbi:MAG: NAD-dependent epimerase/dehydratase family protein, partial [Deltaproteobacteria bacterium]|nr:NAD-dependent epimerase/dehydratase family protein [Deltaproteobacteria bacterium]